MQFPSCFRTLSWCKFLNTWVKFPCRSIRGLPLFHLRSNDTCSFCNAVFQCNRCAGAACDNLIKNVEDQQKQLKIRNS